MEDDKAKKGRKKLDDSMQKSTYIKLRVSEEEKEILTKKAAENKVSVSEFIRRRAIRDNEKSTEVLLELACVSAELYLHGDYLKAGLQLADAQGFAGSEREKMEENLTILNELYTRIKKVY